MSLSGTWRLSCPGPWPLEGSQPQRGAREHTGPAPGSVSRGQEQKAYLGPLLGRGFRSKVPQPVLGPLTAGRAADCHVPAEPPGAPFPAHRGRANRSTCLPGQLWLRVRPRRCTGQRTRNQGLNTCGSVHKPRRALPAGGGCTWRSQLVVTCPLAPVSQAERTGLRGRPVRAGVSAGGWPGHPSGRLLRVERYLREANDAKGGRCGDTWEPAKATGPQPHLRRESDGRSQHGPRRSFQTPPGPSRPCASAESKTKGRSGQVPMGRRRGIHPSREGPSVADSGLCCPGNG